MSRARILVVHPHLNGVGGANTVAAWTIQALLDDYDVTLAALRPLDLAAINRTFGTSLRQDRFAFRQAPDRYHLLGRAILTRGALLESNLAVRWARKLEREHHFDVLLSTQNEADFGRPGIEYIHYPGWYLPRPEVEMGWIHRVPGVLRFYRSVCFRSSGTTPEGLRRNLSLANSEFVAERFREVHGRNPIVLTPPVPGTFPARAWSERLSGVVGVGRFSPYKRWGMALEIVEAVRQRGHDLPFTLIGQVSDDRDAKELRRLEALTADRPWFRILKDLSREQLAEEVARHRYGIHTMENEHFGIAVAELQRAGCLPFVHASGGPMEIVGNDPRLMFHGIPDGAEKIQRAMEDRATERELLALIESRRECYSTERFCQAMREIVADFVRRQQLQPATER